LKKNSRLELLFSLLLLLLLLLPAGFLVFIFRFHQFNEVSVYDTPFWRINAEYTLNMLQNWLDTGILNSKLTLYLGPSATPLPESAPYYSYPQGFLFPLYLIAKIFNLHLVEIGFIDLYSAVQHLLIAIVLSCFSFFFLKEKFARNWESFIFSTLIGLFALTQPALAIFFQTSYFVDQASVLPYVCFICSFYLATSRDSEVYKWTLFATSAWAASTDHVFFILLPFACLLLAISSIEKKIKNKLMLSISIPLALGFALYLYPPITHGNMSGISELFNKFLGRSGLSVALNPTTPEGSYWVFFSWLKSIKVIYGDPAFFILLLNILVGCLIFLYFLKTKKLKTNHSIVILSTLPPALHAIIFSEHYHHHPYNSVRLTIVLIMPFIFYGGLLAEQKRKNIVAIASLVFPMVFVFSVDFGSRMIIALNINPPEVKIAKDIIRKYPRGESFVLNLVHPIFTRTNPSIYRLPFEEMITARNLFEVKRKLIWRKSIFPNFNLYLIVGKKGSQLLSKKAGSTKIETAGRVYVAKIHVDDFLVFVDKLTEEELTGLTQQSNEIIFQARTDSDYLDKVKDLSPWGRILFSWEMGLNRWKEIWRERTS